MKEINGQIRKMVLDSKWLDKEDTEISFILRGNQILVVDNKNNKIIIVMNYIHSITINEDSIELFHADMNDCDESYFIYPVKN